MPYDKMHSDNMSYETVSFEQAFGKHPFSIDHYLSFSTVFARGLMIGAIFIAIPPIAALEALSAGDRTPKKPKKTQHKFHQKFPKNILSLFQLFSSTPLYKLY